MVDSNTGRRAAKHELSPIQAVLVEHGMPPRAPIENLHRKLWETVQAKHATQNQPREKSTALLRD